MMLSPMITWRLAGRTETSFTPMKGVPSKTNSRPLRANLTRVSPTTSAEMSRPLGELTVNWAAKALDKDHIASCATVLSRVIRTGGWEKNTSK